MLHELNKPVRKVLGQKNPGRLGPIPVRSGRFGPGRLDPVTGHLGP